MIYKFKSKSAGDVIMTGPVGDAVLRAMGREAAAQGILQAADLDGLLVALDDAIAADEAQAQGKPSSDEETSEAAASHREGLRLRQRAWPLREMMKRAQASGHDVVWGV